MKNIDMNSVKEMLTEIITKKEMLHDNTLSESELVNYFETEVVQVLENFISEEFTADEYSNINEFRDLCREELSSLIAENCKPVMKIVSTEISDYEDTTVIVKIDINDDSYSIAVQTLDGEYRPDLGCDIYDLDAYSRYLDSINGIDLDEIIECAETFIQDETPDLEPIGEYEGRDVYVRVASSGKYELVSENTRFINKDTSSYQTRYNEIEGDFNSEEEAINWLKENQE